MLFRSFHVEFFHELKGKREIKFAKLRNGIFLFALLLPKIITGKSQYNQIFAGVPFVKLLQSMVLRCKTTLAGGIHNQKFFAPKIAQGNILTGEGFNGEGMKAFWDLSFYKLFYSWEEK